MAGHKTSPPTSKAQARLFGAVAGGKRTKAKDLSAHAAKKDLKGVTLSRLKERA